MVARNRLGRRPLLSGDGGILPGKRTSDERTTSRQHTQICHRTCSNRSNHRRTRTRARELSEGRFVRLNSSVL